METFKESCSTKISLLADWHKAAEIYTKAVADLTRQIGSLTKAEYDGLAKAAEQARQRSVEAQAKLDSHINQHRCQQDGGEAAA